jgi:hypothetical protein
MLPDAYAELAELASTIEMGAAVAPPLPLVFKNANRPDLLQNGQNVLKAGVATLGMRFFIHAPEPMSDLTASFPLNYMTTRPQGSHTVVFSHDDYLSTLLRVLGLISGNSDPADWAIYPLESIVFAFGERNVSIVRMTGVSREADGFMPGNFANKVLWTGSLDQFNAKVAASKQKADAWQLDPEARRCLNELRVCRAPTLDVVY